MVTSSRHVTLFARTQPQTPPTAGERYGLTRRADPHELALVGAAHSSPDDDRVTIGDQIILRRPYVWEGSNQPRDRLFDRLQICVWSRQTRIVLGGL
jgi:hypothetical protein